MKFLVTVPANTESEAGVLPDPKIFEEMTKFNEELVKAGVMLAAEGLAPSSKGARVTYAAPGKTTVTDGPFAESKELIAGFWIIQAKSKQEAIEWMKRAPFGGGISIDIRQIEELEDLGDAVPPDVRAKEEELRKQVAANRR